MNLQPAIEELKNRRDQMKEQLSKIEAAIPVLEDLNAQYGAPIESHGNNEKKQRDKSMAEPISLPPPKVTPRPIPNKITTDKFICEECHCAIFSKSSFDQHNELFHSGKNRTLSGNTKHPCNYCKKRFETEVGLKEHIEFRHSGELEKS